MCDCIKKIEKTCLELNIKNKIIERTEFISGALMLSTGMRQSCSVVELIFKGQKKKGTQNIIHTYCPFCGEKYPEIK